MNKKKRKVRNFNPLAWNKLKVRMTEAGLNSAEQEIVRNEILHREALISRESLVLY